MSPEGVLETCVYAADLEAAERFYTDIMGLTRHSAVAGRHVFFRSGAGMFLVFNPAATQRGLSGQAGAAAAPHGATGPGHVAFRVTPEALPAWRDRLTRAGIGIELETTWPGGGHSIYLRDPAGNSVELATPDIWGLPATTC